jgi:hypothetical protein
MISLSLDNAHSYILHVLDELKNTEDMAMLAETEDLDTRKMAEGFLIEAVLKAHKDAPANMIDGKVGIEQPRKEEEINSESTYDYKVSIVDNIAEIVFLQKSARLASLKASDSFVVVTDVIWEDQPMARMQHNKFVRGTYDDPRLVVKQSWENDFTPEYLYYSVKDTSATFRIEYYPYPELKDNSVLIADKLEYPVLNLLASMVLDALSLTDKSAIYKNKYVEYLQLAK